MTLAYSLNSSVRLYLLRMQGNEEGCPQNGGLSSVWGCATPRERLVKAGCQVFPSGGRESVAVEVSLFQSTGSTPSYHSVAKDLVSSFIADLVLPPNTVG